MKRSAIILAGGKSERLGEDKALLQFHGRMLIEHVVEAARNVCEQIVISCRDEEQKGRLSMHGDCVVDRRIGYGPLEGIYEGCLFLESGYTCVLACDMPFVSERVVEFLFECAESHSASIPVYLSGMFEPLHSVYRVEEMRQACEGVFKKDGKKIFDMIDLLEDVVYVATERIRAIDPDLATFVNINTKGDLEVYG